MRLPAFKQPVEYSNNPVDSCTYPNELATARSLLSSPSANSLAVEVPQGIFGVPLITSIPYANVAISLFNEHGESYIYGYVPIVVAKCGVFLKEKGRSYYTPSSTTANTPKQLMLRVFSG